MTLQFTVFGTPRPQGSQRAITLPNSRFSTLISDNKKLRPWRQEIARTLIALPNRPSEPSTAPIGIVLDFHFLRPKSAKKRPGMTVKPDLDKLCRSIFDSIRGVIYVDDAQVIDARIRKHYCPPGDLERVEIFVGEL